MQNRSKMTYLEAARGIASVIVVVHHFSLAFIPSLKSTMSGTPLYAFFNGNAAVLFFFTLSGFVLTYKFFLSPSPGYILTASVKRLPRLMLPAGASIMCGWLLISMGLVFYGPAAAISGSDWLADMGNARLPVPFHPSFLGALSQSLKVFLLQSNFYYNSNLWTMRPEFFGSLVVFAVALIALAPIGRVPKLAFLVAATAAFQIALPIIVPFIVGGIVAFVLAKWQIGVVTSPWAALVMAVVAILGFSSTMAELQIATSAFIIFGLIMAPGVAIHFSGKIGLMLGKISFPLYLVHTLVIMSAASFVFKTLAPASMGWAIAATAITTVVCSALALIPFVFLESWWVPFLNRLMGSLQQRLMIFVAQMRREKTA